MCRVTTTELVIQQGIFSKAPAKQGFNAFVQSLSTEQRQMLAQMLHAERTAAIHDVSRLFVVDTRPRGRLYVPRRINAGRPQRYGNGRRLRLTHDPRHTQRPHTRGAGIGQESTLFPLTLDLKSGPIIRRMPASVSPHLDLSFAQSGRWWHFVSFHGAIEFRHQLRRGEVVYTP